ncbi:hypothetical protein BHM03_00037192 [Ensete ventricosum]|nr:hypothetical protein BHM03_00037192 [Ensete ventricosum]
MFLLHFCNEGSEEEGWPATASPHAGSATHGQAGCNGHPVADKAPCKGTAGHDFAGAAASMCGCLRAWQAPTGVALAGEGCAHGQAAGGGCLLRGSKGQPRGQGYHLQGLSPARVAAPTGAAPSQGGIARQRGAARGQQRLPQGRLPTPTTCSAAACAWQWRRRS